MPFRKQLHISQDSALGKFLGLRRIYALLEAARKQSIEIETSPVAFYGVLAALFVGVVPLTLGIISGGFQFGGALLPLVIMGTATLMAILLRNQAGIPYRFVNDMKASLSRVHTAFALGCVPAILIVIADPHVLTHRSTLIHDASSQFVGSVPPFPKAELLVPLAWVVLISLWASVTEEFIFRNCVLSVLRRWRILQSQFHRDCLAITVSSLLFGLGHWPTWGPFAAFALVFLGVGFSVGYIANGESLTPNIIYHFAFDVVSLLVSVLLSRG